MCCVPFWNICHPETCFRLAWCALLKKRAFLKHSYFKLALWKLRHFKAACFGRLWSTKYLCNETKSTTKLHLFVYFSVINVGLLQMQWVKETYCCLLLKWQSLHGANLKNVSEIHIFQNGTPCLSVACFRMAHVSEWHATHTSIFRFCANWNSVCVQILLDMKYVAIRHVHSQRWILRKPETPSRGSA